MDKLKKNKIFNVLIFVLLIVFYMVSIAYNFIFYYFGHSTLSNSIISIVLLITWCIFVFLPTKRKEITYLFIILYWTLSLVFNCVAVSMNGLGAVLRQIMTVGCILFRVPFHGIDLFSRDSHGLFLGKYVYDTNVAVTIIIVLFSLIFITTCFVKIKK